MDTKYYTPDISDLFIGYECEIGNMGYAEAFNPKGKDWRPIVIGKNDEINDFASFPYYDIFVDFADNLSDVRTKYLDKSDIEACGWKEEYLIPVWIETTEEDCRKNGYSKEDHGYWHDLVNLFDNIWIIQKRWYRNLVGQSCEQLFKGEIKSKNELLKIMQYLNIK